MAPLVISSPHCLLHDAGPRHVENRQRLEVIDRALAELSLDVQRVISQRSASLKQLTTVHDPSYVQHVLSLRGKSASLDEETHLGPQSVDAAEHAAGACLTLVDALLDGSARRGMALTRPPGHHANASAGSGFCVFNNIAIAATHALRSGVCRVLIVDWDVHHGNGTQSIFYTRDDVYFFDVHQDGLYPDTGAADETGTGAGRGYTTNLPLVPLSTDDDYLRAIEPALTSIADSYRPELVLVSCGFDAHAEDSEGGMSLSADGFARLTRLACKLADQHARGRLGLILEGGYALSALPDCARATLCALSEGA